MYINIRLKATVIENTGEMGKKVGQNFKKKFKFVFKKTTFIITNSTYGEIKFQQTKVS